MILIFNSSILPAEVLLYKCGAACVLIHCRHACCAPATSTSVDVRGDTELVALLHVSRLSRLFSLLRRSL